MSSFSPVEHLDLFCRFCGKTNPAQLDRSIAENGRTVDRNSIFEYYCTKCLKTVCFSGNDLLEQPEEEKTEPHRDYRPSEHFVIGETIFHKVFNELGTVVGKEHGHHGKILVNFEKSGLKKLIQDM